MTNTKRDEADKDASRPAEREALALPTPEEAAKLEAKENEINAEFREDVAKAVEKRDKALAKLPRKRGANTAEIAWNETKAEDDPAYNAIASDYRQKLDTVVQAIRETGNADVVGLEAFEERVKELLAEEKEAEGTPTKVAAKAKANAAKGK
jgi:hypothetical protein